MKIYYEPDGINNFHNSDGLHFIVSGQKLYDGEDEVYVISKGQANRAMRHFCGITDCRCPAGAVRQLNEDETLWGLPVKYCD